MFSFMTTNKKQQCYALCFFSWRPIKNNSVTPYVFFHDDHKKQQCYPLWFFSWWPKKNNSVTPYVLFDGYLHLLPLMFISWRPMKNDRVTPMFFPCWPIKNNSGTAVDVIAGIRTWAVQSVNLRTYQCTIKTLKKVVTMFILDVIISMKWK